MAKVITPLTDSKCNGAKPKEKDYKLFDGGGLFLLIKKNGTKSWRLKYNKPDGRETVIVFGNYPILSLRDARDYRDKNKELLLKGIDPVDQKSKEKADKANINTFETVARSWIKQTEKEKSWKPIHTQRVTRIIEIYLIPPLGKRKVDTLTFKDLLLPIQTAMDKGVSEVALRLRQILIGIMRHALFKGLIDTNPALDLIGLNIGLKRKHRAALPLERLPELITNITNYKGHAVTQIALQLNLQVFIRSSELRFARWDEIDFKNKLWTIPATRPLIEGARYSDRGTKMMIPHIVPLSNQVLKLFRKLHEITGQYDLIFSYDGKKPLSENAIIQALKRLGYSTTTDICGHGFRTMACSALIESGKWTKDAVERQMSHQERNNVRAAYIHKAEHLKERRVMMQWWSDYLDTIKEQGFIAPYQYE